MRFTRALRGVFKSLREYLEAVYVYRFPHSGTTLAITDSSIVHIETRGLFSIFLEVLDLITAYGDKEITVDLRHTPYNESTEKDMWTQYFEPVRNDVRKRYDLSFLPARAFRYRKIKEDALLLGVLHQVLRERVSVQPHLIEKVEAFRRHYLPETGVIGVHIRGTDHARMYGNPPDLESYFREIDRLLNQGYTNVFLATDDAHYYQAFKERYGDALIAYATHRTEGGTGLHFANNAPKEVGEEVIIDWLLLSTTQYFLHGESNVATAVLIENPGLPHKNLLVS